MGKGRGNYRNAYNNGQGKGTRQAGNNDKARDETGLGPDNNGVSPSRSRKLTRLTPGSGYTVMPKVDKASNKIGTCRDTRSPLRPRSLEAMYVRGLGTEVKDASDSDRATKTTGRGKNFAGVGPLQGLCPHKPLNKGKINKTKKQEPGWTRHGCNR